MERHNNLPRNAGIATPGCHPRFGGFDRGSATKPDWRLHYVPAGIEADGRIPKVCAFLAANLHRPLRLRDLADSAHLSVSRFSRVFKSETNLTPAAYFKRLRLGKAKLLLETTPLSVKEITFELGFTDPSHFIRAFRRSVGVTPGRYKNRPLLAAGPQGAR